MSDVLEQAVRCSTWARAEALDPVGSVGAYRGYLLVEVPLPWPRDVGLIPDVQVLTRFVSERGLRLQALVPPVRSPERRVILYTHSDEWFSGLQRRSAVVPEGGDLVAAVAALVGAPEDAGRDLLVCTHGRRDICCGSSGTQLALHLTNGDRPADVTVWRTSHTGGHRFAPTFLLMPDATGWAFADPALVHHVVDRSVPFAAVAAHYRGCAGLAGPLVQALEREVLAAEGWEIMDRPRRGFETGEAARDGSRVVRLEVSAGGDAVDAWEARVSPGRVLPTPDCGKPLSEAKKSETEWVVSGLRQV